MEFPAGDLLPVLGRGGKTSTRVLDPTGSCVLLRPNHLSPPFNSPAMRRALLGATDQTELPSS